MNRCRARTTLALALGALLASGAASAQEAAWAGRVSEGVRLMDRYLADHPDDAAARLDRARFLAWRGDYAAAIEALDALGTDPPETRALRPR